MNDAELAAKQYDAMASHYSKDNDDGVWNSLYERPAMLRLLGDVQGLRVLDLGCGAGQLSLELIRRGATVTGIDVSAAMVEIARGRLGEHATFVVADVSQPLPFEHDSFDLVVGSLVMHYVEDWVSVLENIRRVLVPGGAFAFSTHHPTMDWKLHSPDDYFAKKQSTETWTKQGEPFEVTCWRRSLSEISREIVAAGFVIESIDEPMPDEALASVDPKVHRYLTTSPHFLYVRVSAQPVRAGVLREVAA